MGADREDGGTPPRFSTANAGTMSPIREATEWVLALVQMLWTLGRLADLDAKFTYEESESPPMAPSKKDEIRLVEFDRRQVVVDAPFGRVVIDADQIRFHRNGRGRGLVLVGE
jgi:hypothetical protein